MTLGDYITLGSFAAGAFALLRLAYKRWQPTIRSFVLWLYYAIDDYVALWQETQIEQKRSLPDTYQVRTTHEPAVLASDVPVPNRETLIKVAALMCNEDGSYTYSANKIAEFVGGSRGVTLEAIRAARGQAEPVAAETHQFEHTGKHQSFARTGVKPLR